MSSIKVALVTMIFAASSFASCQAETKQGLPSSIASIGVTKAEWNDIQTEVRIQSHRAGIAEAALMAVAERSGSRLANSGRFSAATLRDAILSSLENQARTIADLQDRLTVLARAADPEIANLLNSARLAIDEGHLDEADKFLSLAEESDLAAIAVAEARSERARTRLAEAVVLRNELTRLDNLLEIERFRSAAIEYDHLLDSIDGTLAPNDWARAQFNLGVARALLAQAGERDSRVMAIAAFDAAAEAYERLGDARGSKRAQQLADALRLP
jgi:hypothetical protein